MGSRNIPARIPVTLLCCPMLLILVPCVVWVKRRGSVRHNTRRQTLMEHWPSLLTSGRRPFRVVCSAPSIKNQLGKAASDINLSHALSCTQDGRYFPRWALLCEEISASDLL